MVLKLVDGKVIVNMLISTPVNPVNVLYVRQALGGKH